MKGPPVYVYHEIVHNRHVVDGFCGRGVTFVDDIEEVPRAAWSSTAPTASRRRFAARPRNASSSKWTPPAHWSPRSTWKSSATSAMGTRSYSSAIANTTKPSAPSAKPRFHHRRRNPRGCTANLQVKPDARAGVCHADHPQRLRCPARDRRPQGAIPQHPLPAKDDICYATTNRQNAVTSLSPEVDLVLVIGSKNSSNSQRLVDRALEAASRRI